MIVSHGCYRMLGNIRNLLVLIIYSIITLAISIFIKYGASKTIVYTPVKSTVESLALERGFNTTAVTLTCINHHSAKAIGSCHHRELLIANLHIEGTQIEMKTMIKKIKMRSYLIIP